MTLANLNIWAILVAALSAFLLGGLWYTPLMFGALWKKANGFTTDPPAATGKIFGISFVLSLIMAFNLAMFLNDPKTTLAWGAKERLEQIFDRQPDEVAEGDTAHAATALEGGMPIAVILTALLGI